MASANKLYSKTLSWDFIDFMHSGTPKSSTKKKWSKKLRANLKREFKKELFYEN